MKRITCLILILAFILLAGCKTATQSGPDVPLWDRISETREEIADGVTYIERLYEDAAKNPYRVYILLADPDKVYLHTGTSEDAYSAIPLVKQDVKEHMQASVANGMDVIAAVNGDFFAISSTYQPTGLCIKNGVMLNSNSRNRPYSAMTKDGKYLIGHSVTDDIDLQTLQMAVGGSHVIVSEGQVHNVALDDDFGTIAHPRTLAGVKKDGTIILAVIDGRQPEHSNGASLAQCASLMISLGAVDAINHDGGGSSTMILRQDGAYNVMNSPSDGNLRKVFCSIQIIAK